MRPTVVIGPNASGKTRLVKDMEREFAARYSAAAIRNLTFRDSYGASDSGYYQQQRWNTTDHDLVPTVAEALGAVKESDLQRRVFEMFDIDSMMAELLIQLSCGELRKFQLAKAIACNPRVLIIDSPFIGLDPKARKQLDDLLRMLSNEDDLELVFVLAREADIPDYAGRIIRLETAPEPSSTVESAAARVAALGPANPNYANAVVLNKVAIRFGDRTILQPLDWTMKAGEKWALEGPNGSGKSTLLSIICADIPQAYACDVTLFDRRRGTGESIWDIKSHIGYVSPELHRAYNHNVPVLDVVASGLHDRQGLYVATSREMIPQCEFWMDVFGILGLKDRTFMNLSSGEQRLVLLARAFVKDPDLLILDEPFHGLDERNSERVSAVISAFCSRHGKSMIMVSHYAEDFPPCVDHHLSLAKV